MPVLIALLALAGQAAPDPDLSWLAGYWLSCDAGREVSETWSDPRAGQALGTSVTLTGDRLFWEQMRVGPGEDGRLTFFAQPLGRTEAPFPLAEAGERRLVFENRAHDFPQRVIYSREGDVLTGRIEGQVDGQARAAEWAYRAAPLNSRCGG